MSYPHVRKANSNDYDAIWKIWMQDHIIQWMSFTKQTQEAFKTHYERMAKASDIYVLIDKINDEEKIVGVRRIKFGKNEYQHIAEYCSMGIDKDLQGKGYAKLFYQEFEKIARLEGVKRIQLTQSGGNSAAFHITDKDFSEEAVFPDWLQRDNNEGSFYLIERYIYRFLDDELAKIASKLPSLKYDEVIPSLQSKDDNNAITIKRVNNQYTAYIKEEPLLTLDVDPDDSVIQHIGFMSIQLYMPEHQSEATQALRNILNDIMQEKRVKKVELFTVEPAVAQLCQKAGFFVRGEKIASYKDKEGYKNELGIEYSFFNLTDAQSLITAKIANAEKREKVAAALSDCSVKINELIQNKTCDALGARYLENLIYQMVRDGLGPNKVFSLSDKRWSPLIKGMPLVLQDNLNRLMNRLQDTGAAFFKSKVVEDTSANFVAKTTSFDH